MEACLPPLSLYVHLPWCVRKCPYCDFNSHTAGAAAPFDRYVGALLEDLAAESEKTGGRAIESIFLGGGTPSLFEPVRIDKIIDRCRTAFVLSADCEITMEANPGALERGRLAGYRDAGINRLSIGAQSFAAATLRTLGRIHGPAEIVEAVDEAKEAGFDNINLDLMFALPGQDPALAAADIERAVALSPSHISYYQLTLEPNTVFHARPPQGLPDDDAAWAIQEHGQQVLCEAGFSQYEVSAFARAGRRCRHNLNYWQFGDYLAAGAGAHGKLTSADGATTRYRKPLNPMSYMLDMERQAAGASREPAERIAGADLAFEFMLNVLRLTDGFSADLFRSRTGLGIAAVKDAIDAAAADGLLEEVRPAHWRPSPLGFRFLNDLQARFLPDPGRP